MPISLRAACVLAIIVSLAPTGQTRGATSAENNPFAPTIDQVNARFGRIQQEVDRLRAAGLTGAADLMAQSLQHFGNELAGIAPSLIAGPELDGIAVHAAGNVTLQIHATGRPIVLALGGYNPVNWTLSIDAGVKLDRVLVSAYEGALFPQNVPAGVPVQLFSYPAGSGNLFDFHDKQEPEYAQAAKTLMRLTGLTPSSFQGSYDPPGTPFSIGTGSAEWAAERVLFEMQQLYKDATAYQLMQDRSVATQYQFKGLYSTYSADGARQSTRVARMTPLGAIDGTIQPASVNYRFVAVDPRGPTYYGFTSTGSVPVKFDPVTKQETALPTLASNVLGSLQGMTFDTKRNRLVLSSSFGGSAGHGFLLYYPDDGMWLRTAVINQTSSTHSALTYSEANDAYFGIQSSTQGVLKLLRFDTSGAFVSRIDLSQFITCGRDICQLYSSGDRLVVMVPPAVDVNDPLLPPLPHSYLIDPATGNVTVFGALPEPGAIIMAVGTLLALVLRQKCIYGRR